ncbi:protein shisa-5-like [Melanotaenia boesemani]|uniref:protein shisa-5-like n=1 Tax=Melanotaenia boesemani TaxID=1250792 RepID=UPI001C052D79|nr:protein shisa-5-like [Melanotaenia boesemani]
MVSGILPNVLCIWCIVVVPAVWADDCNSYWDMNDNYHDVQSCYMYCCGNCNDRYCCSDKKNSLTQEKQDGCPGSVNNKSKNIALIMGNVIGALILIIICVTVITCCMVPCCLCYKKCRKTHNQRQIAMITTVNTPQPTVSPTGYQSVPRHEGPPMPTAPPPSYLESTNPAPSTFVFSQGQPMYTGQASSEPHSELPHSDALVQPPYNPSYGPNP